MFVLTLFDTEQADQSLNNAFIKFDGAADEWQMSRTHPVKSREMKKKSIFTSKKELSVDIYIYSIFVTIWHNKCEELFLEPLILWFQRTILCFDIACTLGIAIWALCEQ